MKIVEYLMRNSFNIRDFLYNLKEKKKQKIETQQKECLKQERLMNKKRYLEYLNNKVWEIEREFTNNDIRQIYLDLKQIYNNLVDNKDKAKLWIELKYKDDLRSTYTKDTNNIELVFMIKFKNSIKKYSKNMSITEWVVRKTAIKDIVLTLSEDEKLANDRTHTYKIETYLWFFLYVMDKLNDNISIGDYIALLKYIKTSKAIDEIMVTTS